MRKLIIIFSALTLAAAAYAQELTIIHFNDTHSHIDPIRSGKNTGLGGVVEQALYIDNVRLAEGKNNVLLLHAGDFSQGTSYFTELHGNIEIDVLNACKYDATCLGNHEFDNGIAELTRRLSNLKVPVVCANYDFSGTTLDKYVQPYVVVKKAGLKIGIIGLLTDISRVVDIKLGGDLKYQEPAPVVNNYAEYLEDEEDCDLVICLSHLGYSGDCRLAAEVSDIDAIVGGHSHTDLAEMTVVKDKEGDDVIIVQDGCWGLVIGELKVRF
jgi:5'-nucleotidase